MDLSFRSQQQERMDDADVDPAVYQHCLADLAALNRLTLTHQPMLRWLGRATSQLQPGARFSVLDVAYGQGDLLRAIASWAERRHFQVTLSGIDLNPRSAMAARNATPSDMRIEYLTGDVFDYVPKLQPDFIVSSQFTHHLDAHQIVCLLKWIEKNAALGWYITDLHRHGLAYYGFPLLALLMRWHRIVRLDGTVSIARGFREHEWDALLAEAGVRAKISWHLPFRHSISRLKSTAGSLGH